MRLITPFLLCLLNAQAVTVTPHPSSNLPAQNVETCWKLPYPTESLRGGGDLAHENGGAVAANKGSVGIDRYRGKPWYVIECSHCPVHRHNRPPEMNETEWAELKRIIEISDEIERLKENLTDLPNHLRADVERLNGMIRNGTKIRPVEEEPVRSRRYQPRYPRQRTLSPAERDAISRVRSSHGTANEPCLEEVFEDTTYRQRSKTPSSYRNSRARVVEVGGERSRSKSENPSNMVEAVSRGCEDTFYNMRQSFLDPVPYPPYMQEHPESMRSVQFEPSPQEIHHTEQEGMVLQMEQARVVHGVLSMDEVERKLLETNAGKEARAEEDKASSTSSAREVQGGAFWHEEIERRILAGTPRKRTEVVEVEEDQTFQKGTKTLEDVEKELLMSRGRGSSKVGTNPQPGVNGAGQGIRSLGGEEGVGGRGGQKEENAKVQLKSRTRQVEQEMRAGEPPVVKTPVKDDKSQDGNLLSKGDSNPWKIPQKQTTITSEFAASFPTLSEAADFTKKSETFRHGHTLNYA
ncbi:hypothetical protein GUITHDRAFT_140218 [Guillardia theta CCMP2712]|uniref:Uncharacterized protein n=1 Tax=Guillardia theta (strain CCMP2712) TaxID=905079 RepID=L1J6S7_GUITC|nr:hypothetical protein GUITHDRAFT_140218 [Guillardia theta CCMP2712]EKX43770.1 hypothetical protein GUITHDRAFT_140218 [Guillardia theta CCMP2712]|eukprot:XP_005830750.1 hypothetical protein GUITHDRAFT_140218 [Guillardia theta CCMP2712]